MDDVSLTIRRCKRGNESKLVLSGKEITSIPSEVFQLSSLQTLDLSNNKIANLDHKISNLENLKVLDLSQNLLMTLPNSLSNMKNLQTLILTNNPLNPTFEHLSKKENQSGMKLQESLKQAFSSSFYEAKDQNEKKHFGEGGSKPQWLDEDQGNKNQNALLNQLKNTEMLLSIEEQKVLDLTKQLDKFKLNKTFYNTGMNFESGLGSGGSNYLNVEDYKALEVDYAELKIGETISQGGFSIVYKGSFRGTEVAIKKIFDPVIRPELLAELKNEISMLSYLKHPNIVLLMGLVSKPPNLCIITEFLPNLSLFDLLHKSKKVVKPAQALQMARQIANVCLYLHKSKVVHRDLKSLNILLDEYFRVKLCDFGLARYFTELNKGTMQFSGTPCYLAPEIYQKKAYDEKIDVFSFGTMLWEIFTREVPYEGLEPADIMQKLMKEEPLGSNVSIPKPIQKIINECRSLNPDMRPNFDRVCDLLGNIEL